MQRSLFHQNMTLRSLNSFDLESCDFAPISFVSSLFQKYEYRLWILSLNYIRSIYYDIFIMASSMFAFLHRTSIFTSLCKSNTYPYLSTSFQIEKFNICSCIARASCRERLGGHFRVGNLIHAKCVERKSQKSSLIDGTSLWCTLLPTAFVPLGHARPEYARAPYALSRSTCPLTVS